MSKQHKSILAFSDAKISLEHQLQIKGGHKKKDPKKLLKDLEKYEKKLFKYSDKNDLKKMIKYQDKVDCIRMALDCCGNGNGVW